MSVASILSSDGSIVNILKVESILAHRRLLRGFVMKRSYGELWPEFMNRSTRSLSHCEYLHREVGGLCDEKSALLPILRTLKATSKSSLDAATIDAERSYSFLPLKGSLRHWGPPAGALLLTCCETLSQLSCSPRSRPRGPLRSIQIQRKRSK